MEKSSWLCTAFTQLCICIGLYIAFNLGDPQKLIRSSSSRNFLSSRGDVLDFYFITVRGGSRPSNQQTHLLKLMDKVSKTFSARFIINISELGEADPLRHDDTENFKWLKVPWYTTEASKAGKGYFQKQIRLPYGKKMDLISIDTGLLHSHMVKATDSDWGIAIGFHPLIKCQANKDPIEEKQDFRALHELFLKFGVNAYISGENRAGNGGLAFTGNPSSVKKDNSIPSCGNSSFFSRELVEGLLLHQVTSLDIITYFVNSTGEVVHRAILRQLGKEVI